MRGHGCRYVSKDEPLVPYDLSEATGRSLLLGLEQGRYSSEPFLLCRQLASATEFAVLTRRHLLCIAQQSQTSPPQLKWGIALEDLFHIGRQGATLGLLSLQPSAVRSKPAIMLLRRPVLIRPSRSPVFSAALACRDAADAEMLHGAVRLAQRCAEINTHAPLLPRIVRPQQWWDASAQGALKQLSSSPMLALPPGAPSTAVASSIALALLPTSSSSATDLAVGALMPQQDLLTAREQALASQILAAVRHPGR